MVLGCRLKIPDDDVACSRSVALERSLDWTFGQALLSDQAG